MTLSKAAQAEQDQAREESLAILRGLLPPGSTAHTILRHVSRSGMFRRISVVVCDAGEPRDITWHVARVMREPVKQRGGWVQDQGLGVPGCGMDMGFHVVYGLSSSLWGSDGYPCLGEGCPSSFHQGEHFRDYTGQPVHHDGYAISQRWL